MRNDAVITEHVTTRDGIRLATDIRLPSRPGPFPVILQRTPYGRHLPGGRENTEADPAIAPPDAFAAPFIARGYAVARRRARDMVVQDTRRRIARNTVFVDAARPSSAVLPIQPQEAS